MAALVLGAFVAPASAQPTPPDLTVCDGVTCDNLPNSVCSDAGFKISLTSYVAASTANEGTASYTYEICSPSRGICTGGTGLRAGEACLQNNFCRSKGQDTDPEAVCSRECAVDVFRGLSHFDVTFPELGAVGSCLSNANSVTGSCAVTVDASGQAAVGDFVLGDGSCFDGGTSQGSVAKCDETNLGPGDCISMTINIAGETNGLGLGAAVVLDKEATSCTSSCMPGPSCDACDKPPGTECLTRTLGFWGTHPWITNDYAPVTVCGAALDCSGASDGKSDPSCQVGTKNSVMEGLGSNPGGELSKNQAYVALVKQLTAAKLNLNATAALAEGASCSSYETGGGESIAGLIARCENLCNANKATISNSGCIEALDAFNNSQDTGFEVTPAPFDRPPVDDFGNISGADPSAFTQAAGHTNPPGKCVVGSGGTTNCKP